MESEDKNRNSILLDVPRGYIKKLGWVSYYKRRKGTWGV